jgi:uncharacterized membrane protein YagU involved in acid resistance
MKRLLVGALAGFAATLPMSMVMLKLHNDLPAHERYPLPPHEITENLTAKMGVREQMPEQEESKLAVLLHFAFGTAAGALYAVTQARLPIPPLANGISYGLALWAANYLGLIPAVGLLSPATQHPPRRTALMIFAHIVWGASASAIIRACERKC